MAAPPVDIDIRRESLGGGGVRAAEQAEAYTPTAQHIAGRTILVAEGDSQCRVALRHHLKRAGYQVAEAFDAASSLQIVSAQAADLVILDLGPTELTGEVLARIRRRSTVPVIVCAAHSSDRDRVRVLNLGADDFVVKPFSFAELEARVRAVLRRGTSAPSTTLEHGNLVVDRGTRTVTVGDTAVTMTRKEFDLLAFLAASPGRVFSREDLLERVWGSTGRWQGRSTVTEHIRRVRLKIETDPENPQWIATVRGIGYRFCAPAVAA